MGPKVDTDDDRDLPIDLASALGAEPEYGVQILTLYIPDRDRSGTEYGSQRRWVLDAAQLLAESVVESRFCRPLKGDGSTKPPEGLFGSDR